MYTVSDSQADSYDMEALVKALCRPTTYSHPVDTVEHIETHISHIFLVGEYAYKIKKPLNLGFLDFTALADRRRFCQAEVRLNRRLAPNLYLDCLAICGSPQQPILTDDTPHALEYAIHMRRFSQTALLDQQLARGHLTLAHMDALAHQLAAFHQTVDPAPADATWGKPEEVRRPVFDNFTHLRALLTEPRDLEHLARIEHATQTLDTRLQPHFALRKANGFIREGHGDLHLGNMILEGSEIVIFDCIEFNDSFRWIDVMSDLGFLLMDLQQRGYPAWANRLLNQYLEHTGDYDGVTVLAYYQAYRAMVRAKVAAIRATQPGVSADQQVALWQECRSYLTLAEQLIMPAQKPFLLITHGVSGSGKSTVTGALLPHFGAIRVRSDVERKRLAGLTPLARSDSALNQGLYTVHSTAHTYNHLRTQAAHLLQAGVPVFVDATFLDRAQRQSFRNLAVTLQVPFILLACDADPAILRARVAARRQAGQDAAEADERVLEQQLTHWQPLQADEHPLSASDDIDALCTAIRFRTHAVT